MARPLWFDELFTLFAARRDWGRLVELLRHDSGPPLFYALEHPVVRIIEALALPDWWARVIPYLAATGILAGARGLEGAVPRRSFLLLAATSPLLLIHGAEARSYALLSLLSMGLFLLATRSRESVPTVVGLTLLAAAVLYTHYLGLFVVASLLLLTLISGRFRSAAGLASGSLLFLPWLPVLFDQPEEATRWIRDAPLEGAAGLLSGLGGATRLTPALGGPLPSALMFAGAVAAIFVTAAAVTAARRDREIRTALLFVALVLGCVLAVSVWRPVAFAGRTEMAVLPVWFLAVAKSSAASLWKRAAVGAAAGVGLLSCLLILRTQAGLFSPWDPATAALARVTAHGDLAIAAGPFYLPARLAAERGRVAARVEAFPPDLAEHPGWISPGAAFRDDGRLRRAAAACTAGCRLYFLGYAPHRTGEVDTILTAAGTPRVVWRHGEVVIIQSAPATAPRSRPF